MASLFEPFTLKSITLRNRIGVSPMCQYSYTDGYSNDWQLVHLGALAAGGAGLVIAEATAVEARGRISPFDVGIWTDEHIEPLSRVAQFIRDQGAAAGIQIAHAGRKACTNRPWDGGKPVPASNPRWWQAVGASPIPFSEEHQVPHELTVEEIKSIQRAFVSAAQRALAAGFNWLEIHAAHGYLLHSFYSPLSNQREDDYGGSFANRTRFLMETVEAVRAVWPENLPLTVRISGTEWVEGGWDIEDSVELANVLRQAGVDLVDCSSAGNIATAKPPLKPGYQVPISEAVRHGAGIPTATVGLITEAKHANEIVQKGQADIVLLGRELLRDPHWPLRAAKELGTTPPVPPQFLRAY